MILNSQVGGDNMNGAKGVLDSPMENSNTQNLARSEEYLLEQYGY
jgi:hypothetical protein